MKVRSFKLGKVSGRKSFELGNKSLLKTEPKGSLIGEGNIKVKIFQDGKGGVKIHMPKVGAKKAIQVKVKKKPNHKN